MRQLPAAHTAGVSRRGVRSIPSQSSFFRDGLVQ
jgi:hypothetical protein